MLICHGAVRSGKTSIMTVAYVNWAMTNFNNYNFAICGKTVGSAIKNIVIPFMAMSFTRDKYAINFTRSDNKLTISRGGKTNTFYIYGGKDESSYMLIQGITLAGIFLDEVALMTQSFVMQAMARCSVEKSKMFFNCNPASPQHWFYTDFIKRADELNALQLHFEMRDNPSLSEEKLQQYETLYSGVFYDRYVRGLWVVAEGLIYPMFDRQKHVVENVDREYSQIYVSVDYGTQNPTAMLMFGLCNGVWYCIKEYYHSGRDSKQQKTDDEYYTELEKFTEGYIITKVIVDPSAASFITLIRRKSKLGVKQADNAVLAGIRETATALNLGLIKFNKCCKETIKEFEIYSWDSKAEDDKPIKENDHCQDAIRYFVKTQLVAVPKRKSLL